MRVPARLSRWVDLEALKSAVRAAVVMPGVFAFADLVIGRAQTSLFAAFGSFSILVLVEFGGVRRRRLEAYLVFAAAGAVLIVLGTLCSRNAWVATAAMAVVGFVILYAGAFSGYVAAAANGAILLFVLPVTVRAGMSAVPDRLLGWALAAGVCSTAALFVWPPRRRADLRRAAAGAIGEAVALLEGPPSGRRERSDAAWAAVAALERRSLGSQHRPSGPTVATAALMSIPDELDWLLSFVAGTSEQSPLEAESDEEREALAAVTAVLRASIDRLDGGGAQADFERLRHARNALASSLLERLPELPEGALGAALDVPFRVRAATFAAERLATYGMQATAGAVPADELVEPPASSLAVAERVAREHWSPRSVWLQNSVRGAVALAVAVLIAQRSGLQHSFWVVLGTLSVLRSNALGTGWSILTALLGTAAGIVVGAALVIGIGAHEAVLWAVLPGAVLFATYAPRAVSFAVGQAAFTVVLFVLFNLIQPVGWRVGVVRVEDVAIGFAISLGVGLLFWPRGAGARLRSDLADAFARAADYVVATVHELAGVGGADERQRAADRADGAIHRLDDSFRQYLTERSATRLNVEDVAALVSAASRVRRAGVSLAYLSAMMNDEARPTVCAKNLEPELNALHAWYVSLGYAILNWRKVGPPHLRDDRGRAALDDCVRAAVRGADAASSRSAVMLLWAAQHLENLRRLEVHVAARADGARLAAPEEGWLPRLGLA